MKRKYVNDSRFAYVEELQAKLHEREEENRMLKESLQGIEARLNKIENGFIQQTSSAPPISNNEFQDDLRSRMTNFDAIGFTSNNRCLSSGWMCMFLHSYLGSSFLISSITYNALKIYSAEDSWCNFFFFWIKYQKNNYILNCYNFLFLNSYNLPRFCIVYINVIHVL